jgi:hypothetical protein
MARLRIGIVGCGEATQILHLPSLRQLDDVFEIVAACDASQSVVDSVARDWSIPTALTDPASLFARPEVDAVLIASPDETHSLLAVSALGYSPDLTSMTGGRGDYAMSLARYEEVPAHVAQRLQAEAQPEREAVKV